MEYNKGAAVPCETAIPAKDERTIFTLIGEANERLDGIETKLQQLQNGLFGIDAGKAEQREIHCFRDVCAQSVDRVERVEALLKAIMERLGA